jgi:hypothetical protein
MGLFRKGLPRATEKELGRRADIWYEKLYDEVFTWPGPKGATIPFFCGCAQAGAVLGTNLLYLPNSFLYRSEGWPPAVEEGVVRRSRWAQVLIAIRFMEQDPEAREDYIAFVTTEAEPGITYSPTPAQLWADHLRSAPNLAYKDEMFKAAWMPDIAVWITAPVTLPQDPERMVGAISQTCGNASITYHDMTYPAMMEMVRANAQQGD